MPLSPDSPEGFRLMQLMQTYGQELVGKVQAMKPDPDKDIVLVVERPGDTPVASIDSRQKVVEQFRQNPPEHDPELAEYIATYECRGQLILAVFALRDDYLATLPLPLVGGGLDASLLK